MGHETTPPPQQQDPHIPFPFQPYPAQRALMHQLYRTMEQGHVGLFESPTGTVRAMLSATPCQAEPSHTVIRSPTQLNPNRGSR